MYQLLESGGSMIFFLLSLRLLPVTPKPITKQGIIGNIFTLLHFAFHVGRLTKHFSYIHCDNKMT